MTMKAERYIVGVGEVLWDMLPAGKALGGAPANFAYHVAQHRLPAMVVSAVGADSLGMEIRQSLKAKGVSACLAQTTFPTGVVKVSLDAAGIPEYEITRDVAWDNIPFTEEMLAIAKNTDAVCFGSLAQRNVVSRLTINRFLDSMPSDSMKIFDINLRQRYYSKDVICDSLKKCNILKINKEELAELCRVFGVTDADVAERCGWFMSRYDLETLILTCGEKGSYVFSGEAKSYIETPDVAVVDTVGAGDAFTAAFVSEIIGGATVEKAHRHAVEVSAYVCTQQGATPQY